MMSSLRGFLFHKTERKASPAGGARIERIGVQEKARPPLVDAGTLQAAYRRNEVAYACVRIKRKALQDPRMIVQERQTDGSWKEADGHPLRRLMMRPMPNMSGPEFIGLAQASMDICGRFYAEKVRSAAGAVVGLNPLNPLCMKPWFDQSGVQVGYTWKSGQQVVNFSYEELLYREMSGWADAAPLAVALGAVDADTAQTDFIRAFFDNGGTPGGIIKIKGTLGQEKADALSAKWAAKYGRRGDGWHRPAVLDDNADYQRTGAQLDELDSETVRSLTESRICMAFGVPPLVVYAYVGLLRATYSNLKEAWASFWDAELSPSLKDWAEFYTWNLLPEFVPIENLYAEKVRISWDLSQVSALQDDVDAAHARARDNFRAGFITLNEARAATGLPPDDAGNYYLRLLSYAPYDAGQAPATTADDVLASKALPAPRDTRVAPATIERRMEREVKAYLIDQFEQAAEAVLTLEA